MHNVGSYRGVNLVGPFGWWTPEADRDGMIEVPQPLGRGINNYDNEAQKPRSING